MSCSLTLMIYIANLSKSVLLSSFDAKNKNKVHKHTQKKTHVAWEDDVLISIYSMLLQYKSLTSTIQIEKKIYRSKRMWLINFLFIRILNGITYNNIDVIFCQ